MLIINSEALYVALKLLITGMPTVFIMLCLVIVIGKVTIAVVNRLPEPVKPIPIKDNQNIDSKKIVAITTAINIASKGKARIEKIESV